MKLRVEVSNAETGEKLDIFEFDKPHHVVDRIRDSILHHFGVLYNPGSFGRGWNHSEVGYTRVDGKGYIERFRKYPGTDHWNVYVLGKLVCPDVVLRRDAMNICDQHIKTMETNNAS